MKVGVPTEIKESEYRVAITPAGVHELTHDGHEVIVESGAGVGSSLTDDDYLRSGARMVGSASEVWSEADLVLKVKEPIEAEFGFLRPGNELPSRMGSAPPATPPSTGTWRRRLPDGIASMAS